MFGNHLVGLFNTTSLTFYKISTRVFYLAIVDLFLFTSFQILLQKWMAFTNLRVDNFTITDSLVFTNTNSPSAQDNYAFCQVRINYVMLLILYNSLLS